MSVLIEKKWDNDVGADSIRVTAAVLPSGKVLAVEGYDASDIESYVEAFGPEGMNLPEEDFFRRVADIHKTPIGADFWIIEDPQEARQIIQEAGLK